jgi:uncharacterized protein YijF (DUF1287 family)
MNKNKRKSKKKMIFFLISLVIISIVLYTAYYWNIIPSRYYTAEDFNIETITSTIDFNGNGTDDYTDICIGARIDAKNKPKYDSRYQEGGYPPDNIGVCTDLIWRAFKNAGYCLKDMVDRDIKNNPSLYQSITKPDTNIDFRRVKNLHIFFEHYGITLTTDVSDISKWHPGDIVVYGNDKHIAIISDKRNKYGQPYIIHNSGQPVREENALTRNKITGHYRFDASIINKNVLVKW